MAGYYNKNVFHKCKKKKKCRDIVYYVCGSCFSFTFKITKTDIGVTMGTFHSIV